MLGVLGSGETLLSTIGVGVGEVDGMAILGELDSVTPGETLVANSTDGAGVILALGVTVAVGDTVTLSLGSGGGELDGVGCLGTQKNPGFSFSPVALVEQGLTMQIFGSHEADTVS